MPFRLQTINHLNSRKAMTPRQSDAHTVLTSCAWHESGHVVSAIRCGLEVDRVWVEETGSGRVQLRQVFACKPLEEFSDVSLHDLRCPPLPKLEGQVLSRETCILLFAKIINMLAGQEAERLFPCQSFMNASSDIKAATFMAGLVTGNPAALLDLARIDAARIVAANIHQIESIAAALIEHKTLDGAEIDQILAGMTPAQRAEKLRRKTWTDTIAGAEAFRLAHGGLRVMI
jgi:hypothetical protein